MGSATLTWSSAWATLPCWTKSFAKAVWLIICPTLSPAVSLTARACSRSDAIFASELASRTGRDVNLELVAAIFYLVGFRFVVLFVARVGVETIRGWYL